MRDLWKKASRAVHTTLIAAAAATTSVLAAFWVITTSMLVALWVIIAAFWALTTLEPTGVNPGAALVLDILLLTMVAAAVVSMVCATGLIIVQVARDIRQAR